MLFYSECPITKRKLTFAPTGVKKLSTEDLHEVRGISSGLRPRREPQDSDASGAAGRSAGLRFGLGCRPFGDAVEDRDQLSLQQRVHVHRAARPAVLRHPYVLGI